MSRKLLAERIMSLHKGNPDKTPVAQDLFTYCTREKTDTWHIVRNHDAAGFVDRVICKACSSEHKYRKQAAAAVVKASGPRTLVRDANGVLKSAPAKTGTGRGPGRVAAVSASSSPGALRDTWLAGLKKWGAKEVTPYDINKSYLSGQVFEHSVFGKGVVQARRENKVDVLFSEGLKTLPSPRPPSEN